MPPKKNEPSKKTVEKQKQKVIEDKTFGIKNKKGNKQQKFIAQVEKQVTQGGKSARELEKLRAEKDAKKDAKKKELDELSDLIKPVIEMQKIAKGVDPKSVLCVFFKQGLCRKGDKCKFSHDLNVARKGEKRSLYDNEEGGSSSANGPEEMESWDQAQLEEVVNQKHGENNKGLPPTSIICRYFLDAVENSKYGWFWECPNGAQCHYRHALPPGFILKKDKKKMEEQREVITLEELIENERMALGPQQTRVTYETFLQWKKRKRAEKLAKLEEDKAKRKADFKQGRTVGISGREMFEFNPDLISDMVDDEEAVYDSNMRETEGEYEGPIREINLNEFDMEFTVEDQHNFDKCDNKENAVGDKENQLIGAVEIDEDLFKDDDLNDLDAELEILNLEN